MTDLKTIPQSKLLSNTSPLAWRNPLARRLFQTVTMISLPGFLAATYYAADEGTYGYIPIYMGLLVIMLTVAFWKRVSDTIRIWALLTIIYFIVVLDFYTEGRGSLARSFLIVFAFMGATFFGRRGAIATGIIGFLTMVTFAYLFTSGILPNYQVSSTTAAGWISNTVIVVCLFGLVVFSVDYLVREMLAYLKRSNELNQIIEAERILLEHRVAERTRELAISMEVSRRLSTILDPDQLITQVVEQVKSALNYYHAHIYLVDEKTQDLVMAGGTGEAGQALLARGHRIPKGKGLVGRAFDTRRAVLAADTANEPSWLPNPLLPDTRSEVAVPILLGDQTLGVLDVQQNTANSLTESDANLLQSLAYQVAIALKNAQTFNESHKRAEREALIGDIGKKIQNTISVEHALKVAAQELGVVLGVKDTRVLLELPDTSPKGQ